MRSFTAESYANGILFSLPLRTSISGDPTARRPGHDGPVPPVARFLQGTRALYHGGTDVASRRPFRAPNLMQNLVGLPDGSRVLHLVNHNYARRVPDADECGGLVPHATAALLRDTGLAGYLERSTGGLHLRRRAGASDGPATRILRGRSGVGAVPGPGREADHRRPKGDTREAGGPVRRPQQAQESGSVLLPRSVECGCGCTSGQICFRRARLHCTINSGQDGRKGTLFRGLTAP